MEIDQAIFIISRISMGLHYSHFKKDDQTGELLHIVHRDISPQNILISFQGEVKITDFGICKAENDPHKTSAGVIKGKVCYLSPEQALGQTVDNQTDIYALGIVSYEMLSGKRLYKFSSEIEAIRSIPEKEVAPLKHLRPEIPDELNAIVMKCLEIDKKKRYHSAQEFNNNLIRLKQRLSITYDASDLASFMEKHFQEEQRL
jgi:serine/threonine protein kinase